MANFELLEGFISHEFSLELYSKLSVHGKVQIMIYQYSTESLGFYLALKRASKRTSL